MFENTFLNLSGHGYLHDVRWCQRDEWCATLNVIQPFNYSQSDDVWLECRFNMTKFAVLAKLNDYLSKNQSVILQFDAKYFGFQQSYAGMSENDPRFIVQLYSELICVHSYEVEEVNTFDTHKNDINRNRMLHSVCAAL
jgi:hypothetical protein